MAKIKSCESSNNSQAAKKYSVTEGNVHMVRPKRQTVYLQVDGLPYVMTCVFISIGLQKIFSKTES